MLFAVATTIGRVVGDAVTNRIGDRAVLFWGGIVTVAGFALLLLASGITIALTGLVLIGLGAPTSCLCCSARRVRRLSCPRACDRAITTTGYAGTLVGPAGIGFVAESTDLQAAFWMLAALMCLVPAAAHIIAGKSGVND